jgi:malic enzyme
VHGACRLYPCLEQLRAIGQAITVAVWQAAAAEGVATVPPPANIEEVVAAAFYTPSYSP